MKLYDVILSLKNSRENNKIIDINVSLVSLVLARLLYTTPKFELKLGSFAKWTLTIIFSFCLISFFSH